MRIFNLLMAFAIAGCASQVPESRELDDNILVPMPPFLGDCGLTFKGSSECEEISNDGLDADI
tara:strand:+ start:1669 stop:1857 length:189 start_codon:yes stop_codon:yes gene_type:complete